jgi:hypothetical protein
MAGRDEAQRAKAHLDQLLSGVPGINGVGLTRIDGEWAVRVNVLKNFGSTQVPATIDGVPVQRRDLTGEPRAQAAS